MTNSSLITVFNGQISNSTVQLCNARDLHTFLEIKNNFAHWIQDRISDYGFIENEDYIIVTERTAGRPRKEYHITLDMGKELGMVERNEKGRQIRRYFIECEKRNLQNTAQIQPVVEEKTYHIDATPKEIHELAWLLFSHQQMRLLLGTMIKPLEAIGSRYSGAVYGNYTEYQRHYDKSLPILKRFVEQLKTDNPKAWESLQYRLTAQ